MDLTKNVLTKHKSSIPDTKQGKSPFKMLHCLVNRVWGTSKKSVKTINSFKPKVRFESTP